VPLTRTFKLGLAGVVAYIVVGIGVGVFLTLTQNGFEQTHWVIIVGASLLFWPWFVLGTVLYYLTH
jgi:hypothetical protein